LIRAVSLDATGTLFRPRDLGGDYERILGRHGIAVDRARLERLLPEAWREFGCASDPGHDRFRTHPGGSAGFWRDVLDRVAALAGLAQRPSRFAAAELYARFAEPDAWSLYDDTLPALDRLRDAGMPLVVTSNWDERLPRLLEGLGLAERFAAIVVSFEVGVEKPHREIFRVAAERLGLPPESILHAGDRELEDVEGARGSGFAAWHVDRSGSGDGDLLALVDRLATLA